MASAPDPKNPSHRTRAHALRKATNNGQKLHESDQLWLADYDEKVARGRAAALKPPERGRSASKRSINFQLEEQAAAEGEGPTAAAVAAGAALAAREEGRRIDSLSMHAVDALKEAVAVYKDVCLTLRERTEILEHTHIEMLQTVRSHYIEATRLEGQLLQRDAEQKPEDQLLTMLMAKYLGVNPGQLPRPPQPPKTKPNGVPKQ